MLAYMVSPVATWARGRMFDDGSHPLEGEVGYRMEVPPNFSKIKKDLSYF